MVDQRTSAIDETIGLLFALMHGGRVAEAWVDGALEPVGLSALQWFTLRQLVVAGGSLPLGQAAERLSCAKSNVTQLVDRLEREGLAVRVPDPLDRRSVFAQITDEGRRRYHAGERAIGDLGDVLDAALTPAVRDQLVQALGRLDAGRPHSRG